MKRDISGILFFICAALSIVVMFLIIGIFVVKTIEFFRVVSPIEFFFTTRWSALIEPRRFGFLPLLWGTMLVALISGCVSIPLGLLIGVYLSEYSNQRMRNFAKPVLEILAGIPSIVYGYLAIALVTPFLRLFFPEIHIFNALSAGIVVGIMTLPLVSTLCDDMIKYVPDSLREAAYALGANKFEVITKVVIPAAFSGIFASFILAFSRAIGETMAVTLAAGLTPRITLNPFVSIQTITAYIVQVCLGDVPIGSIEYKSLYACGMMLFLITLLANLYGNRILSKFRAQLK